jgi:hypothetical protein
MSRNSSPTAFLSVRIAGALALLLVCGAALLGGAQKSKASAPGFWRAGHQAPLVNVTAYPKDFQRSESRWRFLGDGDDQLDQPLAVEAYPYPKFNPGLCNQVVQLKDEALPLESRYRLQPPRAPPLA